MKRIYSFKNKSRTEFWSWSFLLFLHKYFPLTGSLASKWWKELVMRLILPTLFKQPQLFSLLLIWNITIITQYVNMVCAEMGKRTSIYVQLLIANLLQKLDEINVQWFVLRTVFNSNICTLQRNTALKLLVPPWFWHFHFCMKFHKH